jgi:hypothetical protein
MRRRSTLQVSAAVEALAQIDGWQNLDGDLRRQR